MFVGPITLFAIYIIIWWVVLFVVLPLGMNQGAQERPTDGGDWGAPQAPPNLKKKFLTTTWIAAIVWVVVILVIQFQLIPLPNLPSVQ